jgi:hypothetical protein
MITFSGQNARGGGASGTYHPRMVRARRGTGTYRPVIITISESLVASILRVPRDVEEEGIEYGTLQDLG